MASKTTFVCDSCSVESESVADFRIVVIGRTGLLGPKGERTAFNHTHDVMLCSACRIKCGLSVTLPRFTFDGKQAAPAVYDSAGDCTLAVIGLGRAEDDAKNAEIAHHHACDCREARVAKLVEALEGLLASQDRVVSFDDLAKAILNARAALDEWRKG